MASRALGNPSGFLFQAINITSDNAWNNLTDATVSLWRAGLSNQHWAHQASQTKEYSPLLLPPYQFEKARHWVELKVRFWVPYSLSVPRMAQLESHSIDIHRFLV